MKLHYKQNKEIVSSEVRNIKKEIRSLVKVKTFPECYKCGDIVMFDVVVFENESDNYLVCSDECKNKMIEYYDKLKIGPECAMCGTPGCTLACGQCQTVKYCGRNCQVFHWKNGGHKTTCDSAKKEQST